MAVKFIEMVEEMRKAQKAYFNYRRPADLEKARALEKKVDEAIQIWRYGKHDQRQLF